MDNMFHVQRLTWFSCDITAKLKWFWTSCFVRVILVQVAMYTSMSMIRNSLHIQICLFSLERKRPRKILKLIHYDYDLRGQPRAGNWKTVILSFFYHFGFLKLFLDAKASADTLLDLCVLHIKVNSKQRQQLYICCWSWNTNGVNWFHPASAHTFSECRMIQK